MNDKKSDDLTICIAACPINCSDRVSSAADPFTLEMMLCHAARKYGKRAR